MEEKRLGQAPEADRQPDPAGQNDSARPGGAAAGTADAEDRARIRAADARGQALAEELKEGGFGDHKGVEGFPAIDRTD